MRIAFFSDNFYPEISGISDSIITTGEELRTRGHEILYVAPWYPPASYRESRDASRDGLPVVRLPSVPFFNSPTGQARIALPIGRSFRRLRAFEPDIIHTQSPYGTGIEALRAARTFGATLVGTNHTPISEFIRYLPIPGVLSIWLARRYESWYYNHCVITTAPYGGLIDDMRQSGFRAEGRAQANPVPFFPSTMDAGDRAACKQELDIPGPMILVSGRLAPEKKVDVILRAFARVLARIPDATVVVTGHGSNEKLLKRLAGSLGIAARVRFVGFVTVPQLERFYAAADVYVVMSTAESQSLSLMQAFANGVSAVAARARGLIDFVPPGAGFLVEPDDVDALAARLTELLGNDRLRRRMGRAGAEFVRQFSPGVLARQWEEIFECARQLRTPRRLNT